MIEDTNRDELIEQYLLGELSGDSLEQFTRKFESDDEFRKEVSLQRAIIRNIKAAGRREWSEKLETMHNDMFFGREKDYEIPGGNRLAPVKRLYKNKYVLGAAASLLIIIISAIFVITKNNRTASDDIFLAYYQPYPDLEQRTRSMTPGKASVKKEAFEAYDAGNYPESIRLFKSILEMGKDEIVLFYLGNAYLSAGKPEEAERTFDLYLNEYKEFAVESKWYLSLSYLKQGKKKEAGKLLQDLVKENNDYSKRATEILNKQ